MQILVLLIEGESKSTPQKSTIDTGRSWDLEKKASGIKDLQPTMVACFKDGGRFRKFTTLGIPG